MNLEMLPDEALEKIHDAIREAYEESDVLAVKSNPGWKEWRDRLEALLTARGVDFDHLALEGESELEDDADDDDDDGEDGDEDQPRRRGQSDDADDNQDDGDDDQDDEDGEDAKKRRR